MPEYDALLLDHDGVLVTLSDRSTLRAAARRAFRDAGSPDPSTDAVDAITVRVTRAAVRDAAAAHGADPAVLWGHREDRIETTLRAEVDASRKRPYDDVDSLAALDCPLGVVSNNQTRIVEFVLSRYDLADQFETVRARDPTLESLAHKKPDPELLEAATSDIVARNPLYVGDSETDVVAAERAGVDAAFLRRSHNADRRLDVTPAHEVESLVEAVDLV